MRGFGQEWWSPGLSDPDGCFALARCLRSIFFSHSLRARRALAQQKPHKVIQCGPALAERSKFPLKATSSIFCRRSRGVQTGFTLGRQLLLGATQCGYCTFEDFGFSPHVDYHLDTSKATSRVQALAGQLSQRSFPAAPMLAAIGRQMAFDGVFAS